jgi:hypothetical protein
MILPNGLWVPYPLESYKDNVALMRILSDPDFDKKVAAWSEAIESLRKPMLVFASIPKISSKGWYNDNESFEEPAMTTFDTYTDVRNTLKMLEEATQTIEVLKELKAKQTEVIVKVESKGPNPSYYSDDQGVAPYNTSKVRMPRRP